LYYDENPFADNELFSLLDSVARVLRKTTDIEYFLNWIAEAGPVLVPDVTNQIDPQAGSSSMFFRTLGLQIYNAMPMPENDFQICPLPKPGRNEICFCGSGLKYKKCCLNMEAPDIFQQYNMLRHVLDQASMKSFATLPESKIDIHALVDTAYQWLKGGDTKRALALLEPWFKPQVKLKLKHSPLFDLLMDIYLETGKQKKRNKLLIRVLQSDDKLLCADALQRKASILMDQGKHKAAWESFREAQRLDPDNLSLAVLEITMLTASGSIQQAKQRAQFCLVRFRRLPDISPDILEFLEACVEDPEAVIARTSIMDFNASIDRLQNLLSKAPEIASYYEIDLYEPGGMLSENEKLFSVNEQWEDIFQPIKPALVHMQHGEKDVWIHAEEWLTLLEKNPLLWNSLDVLDDLVMAADALEVPELNFLLFDPLLNRAVALLEKNLETFDADKHSLPWLMRENRPALRSMARKVFYLLHERDEPDEFIQLAERLLHLNPTDNHGNAF